MKVFVTIALMDGKISEVHVWKSKRDAKTCQRVMVESMAETFFAECVQMDSEKNAHAVLDLRLKNSAVHLVECSIINPSR